MDRLIPYSFQRYALGANNHNAYDCDWYQHGKIDPDGPADDISRRLIDEAKDEEAH